MYPQARKIHAVLTLFQDRAMTAAEIAEMARVPVESCRIMLWMMMDRLGVVEQCGAVKCGAGRRRLWRIAEKKEPERLPIDDLLAMMRARQCRN